MGDQDRASNERIRRYRSATSNDSAFCLHKDCPWAIEKHDADSGREVAVAKRAREHHDSTGHPIMMRASFRVYYGDEEVT